MRRPATQDIYRLLLNDITPYIRGLAARHIGNREVLEDVVQNVLTVQSVRHNYDPSRPFGPWLAAITNLPMVDALRRRGRIGAHEAAMEEEHDPFAAADPNLQEKTEDVRSVGSAIEQLLIDVEYRRSRGLCVIEGPIWLSIAWLDGTLRKHAISLLYTVATNRLRVVGVRLSQCCSVTRTSGYPGTCDRPVCIANARTGR